MCDLQDDLLRLTRERDAERAERQMLERELRRISSRLRKALVLIAALKQRETQSRRARARSAGSPGSATTEA